MADGEAVHIDYVVTVPAPGFTPKDTFLIINSTSPVWYIDNLKVDVVTSTDSDVSLWADPLTANTVTTADTHYSLIKEGGAGSLTYNGGWKSVVYSANSNDHELDRGFKVSLPAEGLAYGDIASIYADIRDNYANATETFYFQLEKDGKLVQNTLLKACDLPEKYGSGTRTYFRIPVLAKDFDRAYFVCKFSEGSGGSVIMRDFRFNKTTPVKATFVNRAEKYTEEINIKSYSIENGKVSLNIESTYVPENTLYAIVAVYYMDNILYSLDIKELDNITTDAAFDKELHISTPDSEYDIRAYIWDDSLSQYTEGQTINE